MEYEKNEVINTVATQVTPEELDNIDSVSETTLPFERTAKSLPDYAWRDQLEDYLELQKPILTLDDATDEKLEEMLNYLSGILDETTDLLEGACEDEESDSDYHYVLSGRPKGVICKDDNVTDDFYDATGTPNVQHVDVVSRPDMITDTKSFSVFAAKNGSERKRSELNEFTESLMIVFMLFSLYLLLSSLV